MAALTPRMRMFAGPNGSGKSTIQSEVDEGLWGRFVNADNIEADLKTRGHLNWEQWGIATSASEVRAAFSDSWVKDKRAAWPRDVAAMRFENHAFWTNGVAIDSYLAAAVADFLRAKLMAHGVSFTFETVMSSASKVGVLERARRLGYRTYLYFVATRDPAINVERVARRVLQGGHPVAPDLIVARYWRCLDLLLPAIRASHRAYLWDNSGTAAELFGEFEAGVFRPHTPEVPLWFQTYVLDKLSA